MECSLEKLMEPTMEMYRLRFRKKQIDEEKIPHDVMSKRIIIPPTIFKVLLKLSRRKQQSARTVSLLMKDYPLKDINPSIASECRGQMVPDGILFCIKFIEHDIMQPLGVIRFDRKFYRLYAEYLSTAIRAFIYDLFLLRLIVVMSVSPPNFIFREILTHLCQNPTYGTSSNPITYLADAGEIVHFYNLSDLMHNYQTAFYQYKQVYFLIYRKGMNWYKAVFNELIDFMVRCHYGCSYGKEKRQMVDIFNLTFYYLFRTYCQGKVKIGKNTAATSYLVELFSPVTQTFHGLDNLKPSELEDFYDSCYDLRLVLASSYFKRASPRGTPSPENPENSLGVLSTGINNGSSSKNFSKDGSQENVDISIASSSSIQILSTDSQKTMTSSSDLPSVFDDLNSTVSYKVFYREFMKCISYDQPRMPSANYGKFMKDCLYDHLVEYLKNIEDHYRVCCARLKIKSIEATASGTSKSEISHEQMAELIDECLKVTISNRELKDTSIATTSHPFASTSHEAHLPSIYPRKSGDFDIPSPKISNSCLRDDIIELAVKAQPVTRRCLSGLLETYFPFEPVDFVLQEDPEEDVLRIVEYDEYEQADSDLSEFETTFDPYFDPHNIDPQLPVKEPFKKSRKQKFLKAMSFNKLSKIMRAFFKKKNKVGPDPSTFSDQSNCQEVKNTTRSVQKSDTCPPPKRRRHIEMLVGPKSAVMQLEDKITKYKQNQTQLPPNVTRVKHIINEELVESDGKTEYVSSDKRKEITIQTGPNKAFTDASSHSETGVETRPPMSISLPNRSELTIEPIQSTSAKVDKVTFEAYARIESLPSTSAEERIIFKTEVQIEPIPSEYRQIEVTKQHNGSGIEPKPSTSRENAVEEVETDEETDPQVATMPLKYGRPHFNLLNRLQASSDKKLMISLFRKLPCGVETDKSSIEMLATLKGMLRLAWNLRRYNVSEIQTMCFTTDPVKYALYFYRSAMNILPTINDVTGFPIEGINEIVDIFDVNWPLTTEV